MAFAPTSRMSNLWMGDLDTYMSKGFIMAAFQQMGENVLDVKMMRNKATGIPANYCFVEFENTEKAQNASLQLSGKIVPGSQPPRRFKLNHASYGRGHLLVPEYSVFVGDMDPTVDDYLLYKSFADKYPSTKTAKVVLDDTGTSRCYGFVRFTDEAEQTRALMEMSGAKIGGKAIHVHLAQPKRRKDTVPLGMRYANSQFHNSGNQYNQASAAYGYAAGWQSDDWSKHGSDVKSFAEQNQYWQGATNQETPDTGKEEEKEDEFSLEDPNADMDVDAMNKQFMERSEELYLALDGSRWHPLDNVFSKICPPEGIKGGLMMI